MSKTYKNGLFKKKTVQKSKNPYLYGQIRTSGNPGLKVPSIELSILMQLNANNTSIYTCI